MHQTARIRCVDKSLAQMGQMLKTRPRERIPVVPVIRSANPRSAAQVHRSRWFTVGGPLKSAVKVGVSIDGVKHCAQGTDDDPSTSCTGLEFLFSARKGASIFLAPKSVALSNKYSVETLQQSHSTETRSVGGHAFDSTDPRFRLPFILRQFRAI